MANTGHGQTFSFGGVALPAIEDVKITLKGQSISKIVADVALPIARTLPGLAKWTVTFNLPATGAHTLLGGLAQGTTGAIEHDKVDGVKITCANGVSGGFDISTPSGGWVTVTAEFVGSDSVTIAAATA